MVRFPKPLAPGDLIAVTAPSAGVTGPALARLDLILEQLRDRGYRMVEGECLRAENKDVSAPLERRAAEFDRFLRDENVAAIFPPWGGELATELLDLLDFETLRGVAPKWLTYAGGRGSIVQARQAVAERPGRAASLGGQ